MKNALILNSSFNEIYYEIGGILYLFEQGYNPDIIIATSFSSITASLLAKDPSIRNIRNIIDFYKFLKKNDFLNKSLLEKILLKPYYNLDKIETKLKKQLPEKFELFRIPLYILSYDVSKKDFRIFGTEKNDDVIKSIISSMTIPGLYKTYEYVSGLMFPFKLVEIALELGASDIVYFIGDYEKISELMSNEYKTLVSQNFREFIEDINKLYSRSLIYKIKTNTKLLDFSKTRELVNTGYANTRKDFVYYKLFRFGRVKETLDLLKRPDLSEEEKIIKAYAVYLEGDIPQAYNQFDELYEKHPEDEIVVVGYANSLIDIGEAERAFTILESIRNKTKNPYVFDTISRYYFYKGEIDKCLEFTKLALNYAKTEPIAYNLALIHYGIVMASLGKIKESLEVFNEAINNLEYLDNAYYLSFAYVNIINLYASLQIIQVIELISKKVENYLELAGSSRNKFIYYLNYGSYLSGTNIEASINYIRKAMEISVEKGDNNLISLGLSALGALYNLSGQYSKAAIYSSEAVEISNENNLIYNLVNALRVLIESKILLNKIDEAYLLFNKLPKDINLSIPDLLDFLALKIYVYDSLNIDSQALIKEMTSAIMENNFFYLKVLPPIKNYVLEKITKHLSLKEIVQIGNNELLKLKLKEEPKKKVEFFEYLNIEDSIKYIDIIKTLSDDSKLKIYINKFAEHWRKICEQYLVTLGNTLYFFNNEVVPINDELDLLILLYLIINRDKVITYGNISISFGLHSENIKPRLEKIREIIEPWTITQTAKYLLIEENQILFKLDENFKVDFVLFENHLKAGDLESAINIYKGDFAPRITHPFFTDVRNKLKEKYLNAIFELSNEYISNKEYDKAILTLESLLSRDILNLEHLKLLLSTLYKIGKRAYAYEWYLRYLSMVEEPKFKFEEVVV
ncbi:MAG: hypothetical protein N2504_06905 [candidate division WOR-3 bacterium]|nr:hypothetical protein [candidate division WOR-3 bacterium]